MIELTLSHVDLARIRFAHSPLRELVASLRVVNDPRRQHIYRSWLRAVSGRLGSLNMQMLAALAPAGPLTYDFLAPPLTAPSPTFNDEIAAVARSHPDLIREELKLAAQGRLISAPLQALYDNPIVALPAVLEELARYWCAAVEPFWSQVRTIATADMFFRMEQFAVGGVANILDNLHPEVTFSADRLVIHRSHHCCHKYDLTGEGIVLVPSVFSWPTLVVGCCHMAQSSLNYPARGIADVGAELRIDGSNPLPTLIGRTKLNLLIALEYPRSTTQLARYLGISAPAVSQHLKELKALGMTTSRRHGRLVFYQRTQSATALLASLQIDGHVARRHADHKHAAVLSAHRSDAPQCFPM